MADQYASRLDNLESLVNEMKIQSDETATRTKEIHMFMQFMMGDQDKGQDKDAANIDEGTALPEGTSQSSSANIDVNTALPAGTSQSSSTNIDESTALPAGTSQSSYSLQGNSTTVGNDGAVPSGGGASQSSSHQGNVDDVTTSPAGAGSHSSDQQAGISQPIPTGSSSSINASSDMPSLADRMAKYEKVEELSPGLDAELAKFVDKVITSRIDPKKYKTLTEKYQRPNNVEFLVCPRVNKEVWSLLDRNPAAQETDKEIQAAQREFLKGLYPMVQAMSEVTGNAKATNLLYDAFEIFARQYMVMNDKRRSLLKTASKLPGKLFSHDIPVTTWLFGDKFDDEIKTLDNDKKLRESMSGAQQSHKNGLGKNAGGPLRGGKGSNTRYSQSRPYPTIDDWRIKAKRYKAFLGEGGSNPPHRQQHRQSQQKHAQKSWNQHHYGGVNGNKVKGKTSLQPQNKRD